MLARISAGSGDGTEACREVQRSAAIPVVHGHRLAGIQPDPDGERQGRVRDGRVDEPPLQLDRRADRLPGRVEHREGLVAAELHHRAVVRLDRIARDRGELPGERRGGFVPMLLREDRVPANVGDQERADVGVGGAATLRGLRPSASHG